MKGRDLPGKIGYCCFYLGLLIELVIVILDKSDWQNIYESRMFRATFCLFLAAAFCTRYTLREYACIALAGLLSLVSWRICGRDEPVRFVVFAAACKSIPLRPMMKRVFWVTAAGSAALILLSVTGLFGIASITLDFGRGMVQTRYCLGMGHPNALHCMLLMLLVLGLYLYYEKVAWWGYGLLAAANIGAYLLTDSRIGTAVGLGTVALAALMRFAPGLFRKRWAYAAGILAVLVAVAFSAVASSVGVASAAIARLDELFNHRIWNANVTYGTNLRDWGLFSSPSHDQFFDMGYIRLFYWYGWIPGLLMVLLLCLMIWDAWRRKDAAQLLLLLVLAAYTTVEAHLVSVYIGRNYPLMLLGGCFSGMLGRTEEARGDGLSPADLLYRLCRFGKK